MKTKKINNIPKFVLIGHSPEDGAQFTREARHLNEVTETGHYSLIGREVTSADGLPLAEYGECKYRYFDAQLLVTRSSSISSSPNKDTVGQTLTISNRENGGTNIYTRSLNKDGSLMQWTPWQMVVSGDIAVVAPANDVNEKLTLLATELQTETSRAEGVEAEMKENVEGLFDALGYKPDITPAIGNGTQGNAGNANTVRTSSKIPGEVGKTYRIITDRPADEGCVYIYGYATYTSLEGALYQNYSRVVEYSAKSTINYVTLQEGEVGFSFVMSQLDTITGDYVPLRTSMLTGYTVTISVDNKVDELRSDVDKIMKVPAVYQRNVDKEVPLAAMCRHRKISAAPYKDYQMLLCTDTHSATMPLSNAVDALNSFITLDSLVLLGDYTAGYYEPNVLKNVGDTLKKAQKPFFLVAGNHDVGNSKFIGACASHEQIYDALVKPMIEAGCLKEGEYTEGLPYWYHDDATNKVRLIGIYEYDDPMDFDTTYWEPVEYSSSYANIKANTSYNVGDVVNSYAYGGSTDRQTYTKHSFRCVQACTTGSAYYNSWQAPSYKILRGNRVIRQAQAQWFLDTLASTPANYGVIVMMHNPFSDSAATIEAKFSQSSGNYGYNLSQNEMQTDFVRNAVIAFIKGENYSENVIMKGDAAYLNTLAIEPSASDDGYSYAYNVSKNFAVKNSGVAFFGFVGGHTHRDFVWKDAEKNVYQVTPCCATVQIDSSRNNDLARTLDDGPAYDSLTAVSFTASRIALAKIGVDVTIDGKARDYEVINK